MHLRGAGAGAGASRAAGWVLVGVFLLGAGALIERVLPHSDEFIHYRALHCATAPEAVHLPSQHCDVWQLKPPGSARAFQLRSYRYIGSTPAWLYAPVYFAWPDHRSARVLGIASLLVFAWLLARVAAVPDWAAALLVLFNLPVVYQMLFDTGPVAWQLVSIVFAAWCVPRLRRPWQGAALGLVLFVAFEHKPIFAAMLPATALLSAAFLLVDGVGREERHAWWVAIAAGAACFALPTALLLFSVDLEGRLYLDTLTDVGDQAPRSIGRRMARRFAPLWVDFGNYSHRVYLRSQGWSAATAVYWALSGALLVAGVAVGLRRRKGSERLRFAGRLALAVAATLLAFGAIARMRDAWAGHHMVFVFPFLLVVLALAAHELLRAAPRATAALLAAMALGNASLAASIPARPVHAGGKRHHAMPEGFEGRGEIALVREVRRRDLREGHFFVVTDWGLLDLLTLYAGRGTAILAPHTDDAREYAQRLELFARRSGRTPVFVTRGPPSAFLRRLEPTLVRLFPEAGDETSWQLWIRVEGS